MSSPPLLEVEKLSVRFGGLSALCEVDLRVEPGTIVAVIGPNGAGKTTLFNAISGLCSWSGGVVRLAGEPLCRPWSRRLLLGWAALGLISGLLALLVASDPNRLWAATVRGNFVTRRAGFSLADAVDDAWAHLRGKPLIERRAGRYFITTTTGRMPFGSHRTKVDARRAREQLLALGEALREGRRAPGLLDEPARPAAPVAARTASAAELEQRRQAALELANAAAAARQRHVFGFVLGTLLGLAAAYASFRQSRRSPSFIARRGIARTFQNIRLFKAMTVLENVLVGLERPGGGSESSRVERARDLLSAAWPGLAAVLLLGAGVALRLGQRGFVPTALLVLGWACLAATVVRLHRTGVFVPGAARREAARRARARELLAFVGLGERADVLAHNLAYGEQRRLEIARALATEPRLLLLDEPAAGMNPSEALELVELMQQIRQRGISVLLIEHHMRVVMGISDHITVLQYGRKIAEGPPELVKNDPRVVEAYLGTEAGTT